MKYWFGIVFLTLCLIVQGKSPFPTKEQVGMFINSETLVLMSGNQIEDAILKKAVESSWELTNYRFVKREEFDELRKSSKYSLLFISQLTYEGDITGSKYSFLSLSLGDTTEALGDLPEFCAIPLSYANDMSFDYAYALNPMLKFMQMHVKKIREDYLVLKISRLNYYSKFSKKMKENGALLFNEDNLAPDITVEGFKNIFTGEVKFIDSQEIQKLVKNQEAKYTFLHHVAPMEENARGKNFKMIFDTQGMLYYYNVDDIDLANPPGFTSQDLERIK